MLLLKRKRKLEPKPKRNSTQLILNRDRESTCAEFEERMDYGRCIHHAWRCDAKANGRRAKAKEKKSTWLRLVAPVPMVVDGGVRPEQFAINAPRRHCWVV